MKLIILLLCVSVAYGALSDIFVVNDAEKARLQGMYTKCLKETQLDPKIAENFENGQFLTPQQLKCFYGCYLLKSDKMSPKGDFNAKKMKSLFAPNVHGLIDYCLIGRGKDYCDTAYMVYKCIVTQALIIRAKAG